MNWIKQYREQSGLTQKESAAALGINIRQYQKYESGEQEPRVSMALAIADFLGTTVENLFKQK